MADMMDIVRSNLRPFIREWAKGNSHINKKVLSANLISAAMDFGNSFANRAIMVPKWEVIVKVGGKNLRWHSFLEKAENILASSFLGQKLEQLEKKKANYIKGLNHFIKVYPRVIVSCLGLPSAERADRSNTSTAMTLFCWSRNYLLLGRRELSISAWTCI